MASFDSKSVVGKPAQPTPIAAATFAEFYKDVNKLPKTQLIVRSRDLFQRIDGPCVTRTLSEDGTPDTVNVQFSDDATFSSEVTNSSTPDLHVRYESTITYSPTCDLFVKIYNLVNQDKRTVSRHISLCNAHDGRIAVNIPIEDPEDARFSSNGSLLVTWSRFKTGNHKYQIWRIINRRASGSCSTADAARSNSTGTIESIAVEELCSFPRKVFLPDTVQFTEDDSYMFVQMTNEIQIFRTSELVGQTTGGGGDSAAAAASYSSPRQATRVRHENLSSFKVAPVVTLGSKSSSSIFVTIAVFVPEIKGNIASATLHKVTLSSNNSDCVAQIVNSKSMFNASECKFSWSSSGNTVLFQAQCDVDKSGSSYYGVSALYIMATATEPGMNPLSSQVPLTKAGPIHDAKWSPVEEKFVVIAGHMPPQCTVYNASAQATFELGSLNRNTISFSPHGRFMVLAGFGNLAGEMDFYDINPKRIKKIGSNTSHCAVNYGWSPDSRNFMTAAVAPRMNVDNHFKVFKYNGVMTQKRAYEQILEVRWQPSPVGVYPDRNASPKRAGADESTASSSSSSSSNAGARDNKANTNTAKPAAVGAYRPPGQSSSLDWTKRDTGVTGKVKSVTTSEVGGGVGSGGGGGGGGAYKPPAGVVPGLSNVVTTTGNGSGKKPTASTVSTTNPDPTSISKAVLLAMGKTSSSSSSSAAYDRNSNSSNSNNNNNNSKTAAPVTPAVAEVLTAEEKGKKIKNLRKKLKQIQDLKSMDKSKLDKDQLAKISTESSLLEEIAQLEK